MRNILRYVAAVSMVFALLASTGCTSGNVPPSNGGTSSGEGQDAEAQQLVEAKCTRCHTIERVNEATKTEGEWQATVERMVANGMDATADEKAQIVDYLTARDAAR